jgi:hypothetical protein
MYLVKRTNVRAEIAESRPFGPGAPPEVVERTAIMEVWGTAFTEGDVDFCEFRLYDAQQNLLWRERIVGY